MKLATNTLPPTHTSGNMVTLDMGISDNPEDQLMILNVLSASLYTDKPAAVLREYGCNAFDANVEAGKTQPIEVGLPNKLEPSLRIRDFGFGMTEEQIANTFVKLGRSTKRNSNAFTGMLGIGSKAGFAYGDMFMVTSYTHGRKVIYQAFRDRGAPRLAKMHEQATNEPDGIEIKVPVRMEDFAEFTTKAERVYRYFKVRPKIAGAKIVFNDAARIMSGTGWHFTGGNRSVAIMGNVGYDLNASGMGTLDQKLHSLLYLGVELEFEIGDLEIAANREGLQYKERTKKAVIDRLQVMIAEIGKVFTDQIVNATCLWDARKLYGGIFEQLGSSNTRSLKDIVDGQVKWKGKLINTGRMHLASDDPEVNVFKVAIRSYSSRRYREPNAHECYASDKTMLVINDLPGKKQSPARERGFFDDPKNAHVDTWVLFTFQTDEAQKKYWKDKELEGAPIILLSSITPAVHLASQSSTGPSSHRAKHSAKAFVFDEAAAAVTRSLYWTLTDVDLDSDSGVYVTLENFYIQGPSTYVIHPDAFKQHVKLLRDAGLITSPVYGFKRRALNRLGPGWVPLEDAVAAGLKPVLTKVIQETTDFVYANQHAPIIPLKHAGLFPAGSSVRVLLDRVAAARSPTHAKLMNAVLKQAELRPWVPEIKLPAPSIDLVKERANVVKEYPILSMIPSHILNLMNPAEAKTVAEVIRLLPPA